MMPLATKAMFALKDISVSAATYYATSSVTGNCTTPANATGAPDGTYTGDTGKTNWTHTWEIAGTPSGTPSGTSTLTIRVRASGTGNGVPTVDSITVSEGGATHYTYSTVTDVNNSTSQDIQITFSAPASNTIRVQLATTGNGGGPNANSVQVDGFTWQTNVII